MSSGYENVVGGKLKLKGKALDVKAASGGGGIYKHKKKKKKDKNEQSSHPPADQTKLDTSAAAGSDAELFSDPTKEGEEEEKEEEVGDAIKTIEDNAAAASPTHWDANLTPAERRYVEQRARIDMHRLAKTANKSHRDRIQDFNQYLANMSEHYDIPKVGPG